ISVAIGANPGAGALGGTTKKSATAGVASFNNLTISKPGSGYTLTASAAGLTGATSNAFTITTATGAIKGRVTRTGDGVAVSSATVAALESSLGKASTNTGADGTFTMAGLAPGTYDLRVSATGFQSQTLTGVAVA